jgi:hypothetical protein
MSGFPTVPSRMIEVATSAFDDSALSAAIRLNERLISPFIAC